MRGPYPDTVGSMISRFPLLTAAVAAALTALIPAAAASAKTLQVCKDDCDYKTIQKAVDASKKGDTVKVQAGTYKEGVIVLGSKHDKLKLKGDSKKPTNVKLMGKGVKGDPSQNGIAINKSDAVTVDGFYAQDFKSNGFYVSDADGYKFKNLIAKRDG